MTISVAINAVLGILLCLLYLAVVGYVWRYHRRWYIALPLANALVYLIPTANYITKVVNGDVELAPLNWGVLLIVLPGLQIATFLYWFVQDSARGKAIASRAQVFTEEANVRAANKILREEQVLEERQDLAAERTAAAIERNEAITERTAAATERIADATDQQANNISEQRAEDRAERADERAEDKAEVKAEVKAALLKKGAPERTADATERLADAAEADRPKPVEPDSSKNDE